MRVIAGNARGRKLQTLEGRDIRPTTDKVKSAIFSSIHFVLPDTNVLDLFAGSGQLGIEAWSRGAAHVTFVDQSANAIAIIQQNIQTVGCTNQCQVHTMEALSFLKSNSQKFDIVFLDPPYRQNILQDIIPHLSSAVCDDGLVICEHETELIMPETIGNFQKEKDKKYGHTSTTTYRFRRQ